MWEKTFVGKQEVLTVYLEAVSYQQYHHQFFGIDVDYGFRYVDSQFYYWSEDRQKVQKALISSPIQNIALCNRSLRTISLDFLDCCKRISKLSFSKNTNQELVKLFEEWYDELTKTYSGYTIPLEIEPVLTKLLSDHLEKEIDPAKDFSRFTDILTLFFLLGEEVDLAKEKRELMELAISLKTNSINLEHLSPRWGQKVEDHLRKYAYMGLFLLSGKPWTFESIIHRLKEEINKNPEQMIQEINAKKKQEEKKLSEFISQIKNTEFKELIILAREISYLRTFHAEKATEACYYSLPLLEELAKRMNLSYEDFIYQLPSEIEDFFVRDKLPNLPKLKKRRKAYVLTNRPSFQIITGSEVEKFKAEHDQKISEVKEFSGMSASKGLVKGIVKVIKDKSELSKVQKGDILVAQLTTPDFVPAMEKAAAVVTDIGGITSHAAIIAREFNKPCIVGTEIATKILKDGDLVEVDANTGKVKILKRT